MGPDEPVSDLSERLAPLVKVPVARDGALRIKRFELSEAVLFTSDAHGSEEIARHALSSIYGLADGTWQIKRAVGGRPCAMHGGLEICAISVARADAVTAVAMAATGPIGVDAETVERVSLHTHMEDSWLSESEKRILGKAMPRSRAIELTCRWVLKEAYGKALGVGLDYDLSAVSFGANRNKIVALGGAASQRLQPLRFDLYRIGPHVVALAGPPR